LVPTARAIPISARRSAASITKIKKISMIPATTEKMPKMMNSPVKMLPTRFAASRIDCLIVETWYELMLTSA